MIARFLIPSLLFILFACESSEPAFDCVDPDFFAEHTRSFSMGFSTWPYAPSQAAVDNTYGFIAANADIYSEHIDSNIPWDAWINDGPLPEAFTSDIRGRAEKRIAGTPLTVSVSLLNNLRTDLASDYDGSTPAYNSIADPHIESAYVEHLVYIVGQLNPDYLIMAIEVDELLIHDPQKWEQYKELMQNVRDRITSVFPSLPVSESVTLHNYFQPDVSDPVGFINEITAYINDLEFASISFYPFFKGLNNASGFQEAFDFLHERVNVPIAFAETSHLSEDLDIPGLSLFIPGNACEQNSYMEILLENAQQRNYEYIIWWAHRDYNELWDTFPPEVKDLGEIWISNGIRNEDGAEKPSFLTWTKTLER